MEFKKLEHMLELQDQVNSLISNEWRANNNPWYRAIWLESAELLEHFSWKWWSNKEDDIEQAQLELVDIWHFGLSALLQQHGDAKQVIKYLENSSFTEISNDINHRNIKIVIEEFVLSTLEHKSFNINIFLQLCKLLSLEFNELYKIYLGKNILNTFRQKNGYKTGAYKKIWMGFEDNHYLFKIIKETDVDSLNFSEIVYEKLNLHYQESLK